MSTPEVKNQSPAPEGSEQTNSAAAPAPASPTPAAAVAPVAAPAAPKRPSDGMVLGKKYTYISNVGRIQDPTTLVWFGEEGPKRTEHTAWLAMQMDADTPRISLDPTDTE